MRVQLVASPHVLCAPSHQELCCNRRVGETITIGNDEVRGGERAQKYPQPTRWNTKGSGQFFRRLGPVREKREDIQLHGGHNGYRREIRPDVLQHFGPLGARCSVHERSQTRSRPNVRGEQPRRANASQRSARLRCSTAARNGRSHLFLTVAVGSFSAAVWPSAIEIQLKQCSLPRPLLVKLPDAILRLDPKPPKGKQYGAHRDRWRRSRPHMATVQAPYCGWPDPSGVQDVLQPALKLVAQVDHGLPGGVCPPGLPQLGHQLREPGLASLSPRHQVLACRSCLSGEHWRSAASRACSPCLLRARCRAARRLERLVRQPPLSADRSRRVEHPAKRLVDRIVRRKGRSDFWLEQDQVASLAQPRDVLATDTALHRRKVVLRSQVVIVMSICLAHRTLARASSLDGR